MCQTLRIGDAEVNKVENNVLLSGFDGGGRTNTQTHL
jgi:hypothetical protein